MASEGILVIVFIEGSFRRKIAAAEQQRDKNKNDLALQKEGFTMFDLHGRIAVVTGASAGLGRQMALALAGQGADVALLARRKEKLEQVAKECRALGVKALPVVCDVTQVEQVRAAVSAVISEFGKVDILVNNAGRGFPGKLEEYPDEGWRTVLSVDLDGVFYCTREFGKEMIRAGYGRIINISSVLGMGGLKQVHVAAYHAAKGAVINFTRSAAMEWAPHGITVNCIVPGFFPSEVNSPDKMEKMEGFISNHTALCRAGRDGELDSTVVYLAADESTYVTGAIVTCDGGWTAN